MLAPVTQSAPMAAAGSSGLNKVAADFEALFIAQILKSAHAAALADDPLKSDGEDSFRALQDETTAKAIATAAPLGVARELAATNIARELAATNIARELAATNIARELAATNVPRELARAMTARAVR